MNDQETESLQQPQPVSGKDEQDQQSIGTQLATAREARGWSIEQVSHYLKLAPRQIEAIEADHWAALPGMAVTRGFVRSYAKLLSVDASPWLAQQGARPAAAEPLASRHVMSAPFKEGRRGTSRSAQSLRLLHRLAVPAGVVIVAALAYLTIQSVKQPSKPGDSKAASSVAMPVTVPESTPLPPSPTSDGTADLGGAATGVADVTSATNSLAPAGPASAADAAASAAASPDATGTMPAAGSGNLLELVMKKDSWLEVRRVDTKEILASRLVKAGTTETFEITAPVSLKIGNAAGVEASFRGAPLDLKSAAPNNIARLTLK